MANLTIRMAVEEKQRLAAWASAKGKSVTEYIKDLVAEDMAAGSPGSRAEAWLREHKSALSEEAALIARDGVPGAALSLHAPRFDDEV